MGAFFDFLFCVVVSIDIEYINVVEYEWVIANYEKYKLVMST